MINEAEKYLQKVSAGLNRLPENEKNEILEEIRNHIYEAVNRQESVESVLDKLGSPLKLAQSYANIYSLEKESFNLKNILGSIAFYFTAGLSSIIVIPCLFIISLTFVISSIFALGYSVLGLFTDLPSIIHLGTRIPMGIPHLIASIITSVILIIIAFLCWKGLKKYLSFITKRYQSIRLNK